MTGPGHYREAERLLTVAAEAADWQPLVAQAQAHATLAAAAATALNDAEPGMRGADHHAWRQVASEKPDD